MRMSSNKIELLLRAAAFIELRGKNSQHFDKTSDYLEIIKPIVSNVNDATAASSIINRTNSNNSTTSNVNISQHTSSTSSHQPRSTESRNKVPKKRQDQDDLLCEEKLMIDEEPTEVKSEQQISINNNGVSHYNYSNEYLGKSPKLSIADNATNNTPGLVNSTKIHRYQQLDNVVNTTQPINYNSIVDNSNSNHSQSSGSAQVDASSSDVKRSRSNTSTPVAKSTGTREVHNKLEKNRRAHLKECFDSLKRHLPNMNDKKTSNLAVLGTANQYIKSLHKNEKEMSHESQNLATRKIELINRVKALIAELSNNPQFRNVNFDQLVPIDNSSPRVSGKRRRKCGEPRVGTHHSNSSTNSQSSAATSSTQLIQPVTINNISSSLPANSATTVITQVQGSNASNSSSAQIIRVNKNALTNSTSSDEKITTTTISIASSSTTSTQQSPQQLQSQQLQLSSQQQQQQQQIVSNQTTAPTTLHLPINTQMINASSALTSFHPRSQYMMLQDSPGTQLITLQTNGPVAASPASRGDTRSLLVVHSTGTDGRLTMYANEPRNIVLAATTHATGINAQTRIKAIEDTQISPKVLSGVTLVGSTGTEITRLSGGADINLIQSNNVFHSVKAPLTVPGGLALGQTAGISIQTPKSSSTTQTTTLVQHTATSSSGSSAPASAGQQAAQQHHEGIPANCHLVATQSGHQQLASLAVAPMTVVSQGGSSQVFLAPASSITGKMISAPILKPVGQGHLPIVNAQYINSLVKPVVVVSSNHQQAPQPAPQTSNQQSVATSNGSKNGTNGSQSVV